MLFRRVCCLRCVPAWVCCPWLPATPPQTEVIFHLWNGFPPSLLPSLLTSVVLVCLVSFAPTVERVKLPILEVSTVGAKNKKSFYTSHHNTFAFLQLRGLTMFSSVFSLLAVDPPSDLRFKILNENTVQMTWSRPQSRIQGYRIQVTSDTGG